MPLEVQSKDDLCSEGKLKNVCELSMDMVRNELAALVRMAEEKAKNGKNCAYNLGWDVPSILGHLGLVSIASEVCAKQLLTPKTMPTGKITPRYSKSFLLITHQWF
ncbi:hypothetical protein HG531_009833 [Fusarium graminearum]|nr:hypothetical protein HG531_009833 [Fusarium graminearum]